MQKKILLDVSSLKHPYTGLGQFSLYLGTHLMPLFTSEMEVDFLGRAKSKKFFENLDTTHIHQFNWQNLYWIRRHGYDFFLKWLYKKYDLWHTTAQNIHILPPHKDTKLIFTIHDLIGIQEIKDQAQKQKQINILQHKINRASGITFISEFVQQDAKKYLNFGNTPQKVICNGVEIKMFESPPIPRFIQISKNPSFQPFLFSIGTFVSRKNFAVLLPFLAQMPDYQLIISGKNDTDYAQQMRQEIQQLGLQDRVILTGEITEEEKYWLYKNCTAFLFPSILEGFGLPVVEAMILGKPVFTTQYTSLPEVGGQRAFYWQDFSPENMVKTFENGLHLAKTEENFAENQKIHAKKFTWDIASRSYWEFYQRFL